MIDTEPRKYSPVQWLKDIRSVSEGDPSFQNYLTVRERVIGMMEAEQARSTAPSAYWQEEISGFDYMFDASPLITRNLRRHCYHITGVLDYWYRDHHAHQKPGFARKLKLLREEDSSGLLVPESTQLGGFGHEIEGARYNLDTLKYYECLIALDRGGALEPFLAGDSRRVAMEIGGGWGGFGYQFKTLFRNTTYILVDLPATLLFSGVYLKTLFPELSCFFYGEKPLDQVDLNSYDFVFLPPFAISELKRPGPDLAMNMVSFQEMTSDQVDTYARTLKELGTPYLYSLNRDVSPNNIQPRTVTEVLSRHYRMSPVTVTSMPYGVLPTPPATSVIRRSARVARQLLERAPKTLDRFDYRHQIGRPI